MSGGVLSYSGFQEIMNRTMRAYNTAIMKLPREMRPASSDIMIDIGSTISHMAGFMAAGRNTFLFPVDILNMLDQTDIGNIRLADIQLPFPAFYLSFGSGLSYGLPGPANVIDGAYVSAADNKGGPSSLSFYFTSRRLDGPHRGGAAMVTGASPTFFAPLTLQPDDTLELAIDRAIATKDIALEPQADRVQALLDGVKEAQEQGVPIVVAPTTGFARAAQFNRAALPTMKRVLGLACNALCLLTAEPEIVGHGWPEDTPVKLIEQFETAPSPKRKRAALGRLIDDGFMPIRIVHAANSRENTDQGPVESTGREVAPHWRRGHWRRQPTGPGRSERLLKWIKPVLVRGDRGAAAHGHVYLFNKH